MKRQHLLWLLLLLVPALFSECTQAPPVIVIPGGTPPDTVYAPPDTIEIVHVEVDTVYADTVYAPPDTVLAPCDSSTVVFTRPPKMIPGRIQAEDFDRWLDATPGNVFTANRCDTLYPGTDVDMLMREDDWSCVVGTFADGEWLEYDVTVADSALYRLLVRYACNAESSAVHLEIDGETSPAVQIALPVTGSWETFDTAVADSVYLPGGEHRLRVVADGPWRDLNWFQFEPMPEDTTTPPPPPAIVPDTTWVGSIPSSIQWPDSTAPNGTTVVRLPLNPGDPEFTMAPSARVRFHAHSLGDTALVIHVGPP